MVSRHRFWFSLMLLPSLDCTPEPQHLAWGFTFAEAADRDASSQVVATVDRDGCAGVEIFRGEIDVSTNTTMSMPSELAPGIFGLRGVAVNDACEVIARGCAPVVLPRDDIAPFIVTLDHQSAEACEGSECPTRCGFIPPDGGRGDGGRGDGGRGDGGRVDGGEVDDSGGIDGGCGGANLMIDDLNCGTCGNRCGEATCMSGTCTCPATTVFMSARCIDPLRDPRFCGTPSAECDRDEYCTAGMCTCRPGLSRVGSSCVDLSSDPSNCGTMGVVCGGGTVCSAGACVAACGGGLTPCGDACVSVSTDPLHCGSCTRVCEADRLCASGECRRYQPAIGCSMCPCTSCSDRCMSSYGSSGPLCHDD